MSEFKDSTTPPLAVLKEKNIFPTNGLPDVISRYAKNISEVYGVPIEMTAIPMLVACGSILKKTVWLDSSRYKNYPQFYVVINTPSGVGKTEPLKRAFAPLQIIDRDNFELYRSEIIAWKAKCRINKKQKLEEPPKPFFKQLLCSDMTPEALTDILYNNDGSGTVFAEELSAWFGNFGRYNKSSEAQMYLEFFDNTDKTINRKDDVKLIKEPFVNIVGSIQPKVLQKSINSEAMQDCGLSSRFLYVSCLDVERQYKTDLQPDAGLVDEYQYLINRLSNLGCRTRLELTPEAKEMYKDFGNYITDVIRQSNNDFFNSSLSKMEIHCLRLALVIQMVKNTEPNKGVDDVGAETMQYAIDLCHYFIKNIPLPNSFELVKMETNELKIVELLKDTDKTQTEIATEVGLSQGYISRINKKYNVR